jgi:hypothetical protein
MPHGVRALRAPFRHCLNRGFWSYGLAANNAVYGFKGERQNMEALRLPLILLIFVPLRSTAYR